MKKLSRQRRMLDAEALDLEHVNRHATHLLPAADRMTDLVRLFYYCRVSHAQMGADLTADCSCESDFIDDFAR